ncbi:dockerin type I domain-containing protein [Ruminococcus albus]|uniref:O-Glycosyl hydrolase n=1 Tax=Ruminococcus albus TaxID=1264 RepID=A0A1I1GZY3_RUMAL|nr:glycoside hydrolase [Ruminococcus albus]SFC17224.1 O-Glycosyl hydrolase [Ruminococcus albus]
MKLRKRILSMAAACAVLFDMMSFPVLANERETVTVSLSNRLCVFSGWGTGFSRWAVEAGKSKTVSDKAAEMLFGENGLKMNMVRYEVSGGDDPTHSHFLDADKMPPSWTKTVTDKNGKTDHVVDLSKDKNRIGLLKKCISSAGGDLSVELCPTSPPYYMTVSGCTAGAVYSGNDNLRSDCRGAYGKYLASAVNAIESQGINVTSIAPMNEPSSLHWKAGGTRQEGCHVSQGEQQSKLLIAVRNALNNAGLSKVYISAADEADIDTAEASLGALTSKAAGGVRNVNIHSAEHENASFTKAAKNFSSVRITEADGLYTAGSNAGEMSAALGISKKIISDLQNSGASAWLMWQAVCDGRPDLDSGYLGLLYRDDLTGSLEATQKYYAFGQFSRYIGAASTLIKVDDDTIAAYDRSHNKLTIVAVNDGSVVKKVKYSLDGFGMLKESHVTEIRTSGRLAEGEHWSVTEDAAAVTSTGFSADLAPNSVTTYVIDGAVLRTTGTLGDVNGDGNINVTDLTLTAAHVKSARFLNDNEQILADVNCDGTVNITDITRLAAHIKGKRAIKDVRRYNEDDFITDAEDIVTSDEDITTDG